MDDSQNCLLAAADIDKNSPKILGFCVLNI
jgi:hypothetical protein